MAPQIPAPDPGKLNHNWILGEMLDHVKSFADDFPKMDLDVLSKSLTQLKGGNADPQTHIRGYLRAFRATDAFNDSFKQLDPALKAQINSFIDGKSAEDILSTKTYALEPSPPEPEKPKTGFRLSNLFPCFKSKPAAQKEKTSATTTSTSTTVKKPAEGLPKIYEDAEGKKPMEVHADTTFENWGLSVKNKPKYTFVPTTVLGLQNLVKYAKANNQRVRCSGYRHSWSPVFSANDEILVSMLPLKTVTSVPDITPLLPTPESNLTNELKVIELAAQNSTPTTRLIRIGTAVTAEEYRRWAIKANSWALSVETVLVEVTFGGLNGTICHGAGHRHQTVSDLVRAIEYVDCHGEHRTVSDPKLLKAAAGCFGLLGIVTHLTLELQPMSYAVMHPLKTDINLSIPPLDKADVPFALQKTWTDAQRAQAKADFDRRAGNDFYTEWFWCPYQQTGWVNTWSPVSDPSNAPEYPSPVEVWLQWIQGWLAGVVTSSKFFGSLPGRWQAVFLGVLEMAILPPYIGFVEADIKTPLPDALHFRRGVQNMRVRNMEFEIPLQPLPDDPTKPDFSIVQQAWWDAINIVYEDVDSPLRVLLEVRIMGDSDIVMAPQYKNSLGTASIEVLTLPDAVTDNEWVPFLQKIAKKWMSYEPHGSSLNCRPHWGKEWDKIELGGMPAREYLKTVAYKDAIPEFKALLAEIGSTQDWTLEDLKARFSNTLWDEIIFD